MTKRTLWDPSLGEVPANLAFVNNYAATTAPGVGNDSLQGYSVGSIWVNTATNPDTAYICTNPTAGAAVWQSISEGATPGQAIAPDASTPTGAGGTALLRGGAGGSTSGDGGPSQVTGGAASAGNGNGGSAVLAGGAKNGTGVPGGVRAESIFIKQVSAPAAKTTSGLLTGAEVAAGMITVTQGGGADSAQQLPTGTNLQNALPADFAVGDSIDLVVVNLGGASETATLTGNTDVTIVGRAIVNVPAATASGSGIFRFRKTADHAFVAYRIA